MLFEQLHSNEIVFYVQSADQISDSLIAFYWGMLSRTVKKDSEIGQMEVLIQKHPDSPIAPRICQMIIMKATLRSSFREKNLEYRKFLLQHYPEHGWSDASIRVLLREIGDDAMLTVLRDSNVAGWSPIATLMLRQTLKDLGRADLLQEVMGR